MIKIQWVEDFFELRRLRRDLRIADDRAAIDLETIREREATITSLEGTIRKLREEADRANKEAEDWKRHVREQTAADLLVNALIGLGIVPKPKENYDHFAEALRLQQLQGMANQHQRLGASNALGGLGQAFGL